MFECTQLPGDVMYIPEAYEHLVLNLWPSAAVNMEFHVGKRPDEETDEDEGKGRANNEL